MGSAILLRTLNGRFLFHGYVQYAQHNNVTCLLYNVYFILLAKSSTSERIDDSKFYSFYIWQMAASQ